MTERSQCKHSQYCSHKSGNLQLEAVCGHWPEWRTRLSVNFHRWDYLIGILHNHIVLNVVDPIFYRLCWLLCRGESRILADCAASSIRLQSLHLHIHHSICFSSFRSSKNFQPSLAAVPDYLFAHVFCFMSLQTGKALGLGLSVLADSNSRCGALFSCSCSIKCCMVVLRRSGLAKLLCGSLRHLWFERSLWLCDSSMSFWIGHSCM